MEDACSHMHLRPLILKLFEIGAVRFGSFPLKSGLTSPIYIDLQLIIAHPKLLVALAEALYNQVRGSAFELVCPVHYTTLPLATAISIEHLIPMALVTKEKTEYVAKSEHNRAFRPKQPCLVIDDVVLSGQCILETIALLEKEKLHVEHIAVLIDREQKGRKRVEDLGYRVHSLFSLSQIVQVLLEESLIDDITASTALAFLKA